jgi:ABC-type dipeptide/oligopeptide/nickel transport system ATPase component
MIPASIPLLEVRLRIDYPGKSCVVNGAAFDIQPGEIVGLVGSSGSGKSSLALALLGLLGFKGGRASGEVRFKGRDLFGAGPGYMRGIRGRDIAFVPQSPVSSLNPAMRIGAQLMEAWRAHQRCSRFETERAILRAVEDVGLPADRAFLNRFPGEISVGQAQRVLIASAILHAPGLLIADEPTSSLDAISQVEILRLLSRLSRDRGMAIFYISHDLLSVSEFCHRVAILYEGRIVEFAETRSIFASPRHPYTQELIGTIKRPALFRDTNPISITAKGA